MPAEDPDLTNALTRRRLLAGVGGLAGIAGIAGCSAFVLDRETVTRTLTIDADGITTLRVEDAEDSVGVRGWDGEGFEVTLEKTAFGQTDPEDIEFSQTTTGDVLTLSTHVPGVVGAGGGSIGLTVAVPEGVTVERVDTEDGSVSVEGVTGDTAINTGDGSVSVTEVTGDVTVESGDGSVSVDGVEGTLTASTQDGSLSVEGVADAVDASTDDGSVTVSNVGGDVSARSGDGSLTVSDVEGYVDAETDDGSVRVGDPGGIDGVRAGDGSATVDVPAVRGRTRIEAGEGSLVATLGPDLDAVVEATADDGSVTGADALDSVDMDAESALRGVVGDGTHELTLHANDGSVTLSSGT